MTTVPSDLERIGGARALQERRRRQPRGRARDEISACYETHLLLPLSMFRRKTAETPARNPKQYTRRAPGPTRGRESSLDGAWIRMAAGGRGDQL
jgi:hypothetical protein